MKKSLIYLSTAFMALLCIGFTACGSDDDDDNGGSASGVPAPTLTDSNGNSVQVLSAGDVWYRYDENGKITSFSDSYDTYEFEGNAFEITYEDVYTAKFTVNGSGLISKVYMTCDLKAGNEYLKANITYTYQYNSERQLTGGSYSINAEQGGGNLKVSAKGTGSLKNTWSNGNIVKSVQDLQASGNSNGVSYTKRDTETFTYSYGNKENAFKQFPYFMGDGATGIVGNGFSFFCIVGLYGVGPANLPTGYVQEIETKDEYGKTHESTQEYGLTFSLNDDGTIDREWRGSIYVNYLYAPVNRAVIDQAESLLPTLREQISRMFEHALLKQ